MKNPLELRLVTSFPEALGAIRTAVSEISMASSDAEAGPKIQRRKAEAERRSQVVLGVGPLATDSCPVGN